MTVEQLEMFAEEDQPVWNGYLYQLQEEAPRPKPVLTNRPEAKIGRPPYFGDECHGLITREEGDALCAQEGNFLIRESQNERGRYTLVLRILGTVKNFKLYWEDGQFFVGDKRFDSIYGLVEDGLITMYVEEKAHDYIQNMSKDRSVYSSLSKTKRLLTRQLPGYDSPVVTKPEPRASPRRVASVRVGGRGNSPRYADNGSSTESAALPYNHYQNGPREYFDPSQRFQNSQEANTAALEDQFNATHMMKDNRGYREDMTSHVAYFNPSHVGSSMVQNLRNIQPAPYEDASFHNGMPYNETHAPSGGSKKSLTPTSSDERKRPKPKKVATEQAIAQQQSYYNDPQYSHGSHMYTKERLSRSQSSNVQYATNYENHGRRNLQPRTHVPSQLQNRPFHQSAPGGSPRQSPQRSPNVRRNNSDISQQPPQYSMMARLAQSNIAHVRQIGPMQPENTGATIIPNNQARGVYTENMGPDEEKIVLDANDNQMVLSSSVGPPGYRSPNRTRGSPRQTGFDSSGSEVIPANTFHQLKMFHRRLEDDEDIRKEADDEVTTLRGHPKPHSRLTRSHTTAGMGPIVRPHSGEKAPPRPAPRDIHYRQRSEPVELFQHHLTNKAGLSNHQILDSGAYRQQSRLARPLQPYLTSDQNDLRAASSGSCDSSLSNVSEAYLKPPDSISHLSSEDWTGEERESSPSPHSTSRRSYSSDDSSLPKAHLALNRPYIPPNHPESRDIITALQRSSPKLKHSQHVIPEHVDGHYIPGGCVPPPEVLSAARPRRKGSDPGESIHAKNSSKSRHVSSETSSEDGTMKQPVNLHKPLARRATTGSASPSKNESKLNSAFSANKLPSPKKATRSNSGPSPRKGKKSPENTMSPINHQHLAHHQRSLSSPRTDAHYYDKEHVFKSHTYRGLQWCEYCGNFMWGIIQQGMQCRDCGLNVHKQCSKLVPGDCQPALKHVKTVFGIDLTALVKLHGTERPIVVDKCIAEIEARGMNSEGIYRVSGFHDDVQHFKIAFDRYGTDVDTSSYEDINIVAGGLKLYLRELPVPLIPYNLYSRFINAARLSDGKLEAIRTALDVMPPAHLQTMKHIIHHLGRICENEFNQMDAQNLGIVFGPTMLRPPEKSAASRYYLNDAQYQKDIVQTMIENRLELFGATKREMAIRETHCL